MSPQDVPVDLRAAITRVLRTRHREVLPDCGIELEFDQGIVATCLHCRLTWGVRRPRYRDAAWWTCPGGCLPPSAYAGPAGAPRTEDPECRSSR